MAHLNAENPLMEKGFFAEYYKISAVSTSSLRFAMMYC